MKYFLTNVYFGLIGVVALSEIGHSERVIGRKNNNYRNSLPQLGKSQILYNVSRGLNRINNIDHRHNLTKRENLYKKLWQNPRYPLALKIFRVGLYLSAYKYFGFDRRYIISATKDEKPVFFKHFPLPSLKKLHPVIQRACDAGFLNCIDEIYRVAKRSAILYGLDHYTLRGRPKGYAPFKYARDMFNYRVSASYYMCWYTMREEPPLKYFGLDDCYQNMVRHLYLDEIRKTGHNIRDFRIKEGRKPFQCALLYFCPNLCYGKLNGNPRSLREAMSEKTNSCVDLPNKQCIVPRNNNINFEDLKKNRLNVSCHCGKGIEWNNKFSMCIDIDECYNKQDDCWKKGLVCQNTKGSYKCRCRLGFSLNKKTQKCEMNELLHVGASKSLKVRKRKSQHDKTFSEKFQIWLGVLSGSHKVSGSFGLLLLTVLIVIL